MGGGCRVGGEEEGGLLLCASSKIQRTRSEICGREGKVQVVVEAWSGGKESRNGVAIMLKEELLEYVIDVQ